MTKYLTSRLLLVFFVKFFSNWAFNTKSQLIQFFDVNQGFFLETISYLLMFLILVLGLIIINILFTILHLAAVYNYSEIIEKVGKKGILNSLKIFFGDFWTYFNSNFNIEYHLEKYPNFFLVFVFFFLPFSKGNPILNNYYGIYREYEIEDQGRHGERTDYIENQNYIVHKSKLNEIKGRMESLEENVEENKPDFKVKKRGYLFIQAGLIDGYKSYYKEYNGFFSYIECILFSALEKLINTIMYFLIPFVLCITIYHYKKTN